MTNPRAPVRLIEDSNELLAAVTDLAKNDGAIAVDAERASGFKYSQRAYLIQLKANSSDIFLIDPVATEGLTESREFRELRSVLADREWILHAATQDLGCLSELGLFPGAIFDTELAARLAGLARVGLGSLTETLLGQRLAKEHSAADWSTRPLPESWLNYAALDVDVLHDLKSSITTLLDEQGKQQWAREEFETLKSFRPKVPRLDRWRSTSGINKISDRGSLEIIRRLWLAREELAQKLDVSPGRLIPDSSLIAAATEKPKSKNELASLRQFSGRASRSYLSNWWEAIAEAYRATELPEVRPDREDRIPNHRNWASKFPEADRRLRESRSALAEQATELALPLENLLTPEILRQLCFSPGELRIDSISHSLRELGARAWQIQIVAPIIEKAFIRSLEPLPKQFADQPAALHGEP